MIERVFLDWRDPFMPQAVDWLVVRYRDGMHCDMRGHVLVFPGQRALRRCAELLYQRTLDAGLSFTPPRMTSVGMLPELVLESPADLASEIQSIFAWMNVLQSAKAAAMEVLAPYLPDPSDSSSWLMLAERVHALYEELSASLLSFEDAAVRIREAGSFPDEARWELLANLQREYGKQLEAQGILDRHVLRKNALQKREFRLRGDLVLLSTADLNEINKAIIAGLRTPAISLVHADPERAADFDDYGCALVERWVGASLPLSESQFSIVDKPSEVVEALTGKMLECGAVFSTESLRIGICNPELSPFVLEALNNRGINTKDAAGIKSKHLELYVFLKTLRDFLAFRRFYAFSSLCRIPDVEAWIRRYFRIGGNLQIAGTEYFRVLDEYQTVHLQAELGRQVFGEGAYPQIVGALYAAVKELIGDFFGPKKEIREWSRSLMDLMLRLYDGAAECGSEEEKERFFEQIEALRLIAEEFFSLLAQENEVSGAEALGLFIHRFASVEIRSESSAGSLELLGWLELRLDDAENVLVTGFNETFVPEVLNSDPFLPDALRRFLGLLDNDKRYARDAYALCTMLHSKKRLFLLGTRQNANGDRLLPSRLLYTGEPGEVVGRVARIFCDNKGCKRNAMSASSSASPGGFEFPLRPQKMAAPLRSLSVSGFNDYLTCPYRFYLKHVLKLGTLDDSMLELDPLHFGILAHDVLGEFGRSPLKESTDPEEIESFLCDLLSSKSDRSFGPKALPAVLMQVEQLRERLRYFAKWQADWRAQGWQIKETEIGFKEGDFILCASGNTLRITGRIDRLDYNSKEGRYIVLDYKVSETKSAPEKAHRRQKEWINLQLPMYVYYLSEIRQLGAPIDAGFISLCAALKDIGLEQSRWSDEDLSQAYGRMNWVAGKVLMQDYWPPSDLPAERDDFALLFGAFESGRN